MQPVAERVVALGGLFELDRMAQVLKIVTLLTVAAVFVYSTDYLQRRAILKGEYYVLGLFATLGAMVLISAGSLITLYLGPRAHVAVSVRHGGLRPRFRHRRRIRHQVFRARAPWPRERCCTACRSCTASPGISNSPRSREVVRTSFVGQHRSRLRHRIPHRRHGVQARRRAVPHVDPGRVRGLAHLRDGVHRHRLEARRVRARHAPVAGGARRAPQGDWSQMLVVLSVLSMAIGNIVAIAQTNIKRMLAYSTISHIGLRAARDSRRHGAGLSGRDVLHDQLRDRRGRRLRHGAAAGAAGIREPTRSWTSRDSTRAVPGSPA